MKSSLGLSPSRWTRIRFRHAPRSLLSLCECYMAIQDSYVVFKESSRLLIDVESIPVGFDSMVINGTKGRT